MARQGADQCLMNVSYRRNIRLTTTKLEISILLGSANRQYQYQTSGSLQSPGWWLSCYLSYTLQ